MVRLTCIAAAILAWFTAAVAAEPPDSAAAAMEATGIRAGLCVRLSTTDGQAEAALTSGGRMLVHGLALDDAAVAAARAMIRSRGLYGLASVEKTATLTPLPYAANLVNLLVADLDALGPKAPAMDEILRVLAPGGAAYLKKGGAWAGTIKPRPPEMDEWTHFDYGPEGNGVSHDRLVRPSNFVQWTAGVQEIKLGGNPAGFRVYAGTRVTARRLFAEWGSIDKSKREQFYNGRDAFSGISLWNAKNTAPGRKDWQFVAAGDRLYTFLEKGGPLVALDADTGQVAQTFDQGGRLTEESGRTALRYCGGTLLQITDNTLYALDAKTGALRWKHTADGSVMGFHCASAKDNRVFVAVAEPATRGSSRWPVAKAQAILCLELATGKPVWTNTEIAGLYVGQLVYAEGNLALFASGAIGGGEEPLIGNIRPADGKLLWHTTFKKEYNRFGYNLLVRDGRLYYADAWRLYAHDPQTGAETRPFDDGGYNMRCNRFAATDQYFIYGLVAFVDRNWKGEFQSITRSGCAIGAAPANGMVYFTPNACGCITQLRGHIALAYEPLRDGVPDGERLRQNPPSAKEPAPAEARPAAVPPGPVAEDWTRQVRSPMLETPPVTTDGRTFVAVTHEHRMECRDDAGKVAWSFTAGGRISSPPVIQDGLCLFGSHDGWVYALRAADGTPAWQFLAAPYDRRVVVCGQLESSWPVYGVTMHDGRLVASAGVHPEVGGGIHVYGLDPKTGHVAWKKVLARGPVLCDGKSKIRIRPNRILNDVPKSEGTMLSLPGITFDPAMPDAELQKKVLGEDEPDKKKGR